MNEAFFYTGIVFTIFFLVLSIIIFIRQNIIEAIKYYFKIQNKKNSVKLTKKENDKVNVNKNETMLIDSNETEVLNIAKNYATTILEAEDDTEILENYNEED